LQTVDKEALTIAAKDETCRRLMTVPGVGAITALAFKTTIDTPWRFSSSSKVGAYLLDTTTLCFRRDRSSRAHLEMR
jgi:transposase